MAHRARRCTPWRLYLPPAVAVAVIIAVVIPIAMSRSHREHTRHGAAAHIPAVVATVSLGTTPPAGTAITPQAVAEILIGLLPRPGKISRPSGQYLSGFAAAQLTYDDGHGAAGLSISIGTDEGFVCSDEPSTPGCQTLGDGDQRYVYQGPEYPAGKTRSPREAGVLNWGAQLERPDGVDIYITEWNSPTEKDSAPTRAEPPFTIAELTTIAQSNKWQTTISPQAAAKAAPLFTPSRVPTEGGS